MEVSKMTLLILTVLVLMLDSSRGIFFGDEESHVSKIRIHVFQPRPIIKPAKVIRHVHFNIQKSKPPEVEVHHPREIKIPISISPTIYSQEHHIEHHPTRAFSHGYAQGYLENNGLFLGSSGSHPPKEPDIHYDLPPYTSDDIQPQNYPPSPLDYGNVMYAMPNAQFTDEVPYDMQSQYADDMLYSGPPGPTARDLGGGQYPQQYASAPTGEDYSPLLQQQQPVVYREIKYPW